MRLRLIFRKPNALACLAVMVSLLAAGCGGGTGTAGREDAIVVREALDYIPAGINPFDRGSGPEAAIAGLVFGALTETNDGSEANRRYTGGYAEGLPVVSKDGLTWTYKLRQDQSFSDGTAADAYAFLASLKALLDPAVQNPGAAVLWGAAKVIGARDYANGETSWDDVGINIHDRYTIQFTLETPVPTPVGLEALNISLTAAGFGGPSVGTADLLKMPSSGPYRAVEYIPGQLLALEKNIYYPNAYKYTADRIEFRAGDGEALFREGLTDRLYLTPDMRYSYDLANVVSDNSGTPWFIYLNAETGALADVSLRKALLYGLDRDYIVKSVFGVYTPVTAYVSLGAWVGDPYGGGLRLYNEEPAVKAAHESYGHNPALALECFNEAFERNGGERITVTILCFGESDYWGQLAVAVRDCWMSLFGSDRFHLYIEIMPSEAVYAACENGEYGLCFGAMSQNNVNPWATMAVWSSGYPEKLDVFRSGAYDALQIKAAFGELAFDYEAKATALLELERLLFEFVPAIPVFQNTGAYIY